MNEKRKLMKKALTCLLLFVVLSFAIVYGLLALSILSK